ncbi:MAG TPA: hypothetical protein DCX03_01910 [Bacteroidales bacterium]|nr:hypothetical protein [Bacteroidales bacterium]
MVRLCSPYHGSALLTTPWFGFAYHRFFNSRERSYAEKITRALLCKGLLNNIVTLVTKKIELIPTQTLYHLHGQLLKPFNFVLRGWRNRWF